jgi:hypothetical protein
MENYNYSELTEAQKETVVFVKNIDNGDIVVMMPDDSQIDNIVWKLWVDEATIVSNRNSLLADTDYFALSDLVMTSEMVAYRQALRDVPQQDGFPQTVVWPTKPGAL